MVVPSAPVRGRYRCCTVTLAARRSRPLFYDPATPGSSASMSDTPQTSSFGGLKRPRTKAATPKPSRLLRGDMVKQALDWFERGGTVRFVYVLVTEMPTEFAVGLPMAAAQGHRGTGGASFAQASFWRHRLDAIANLRTVFARGSSRGRGSRKPALRSFDDRQRSGRGFTMVGLVRLGHFDTLVEFEIDRERRRAGAVKTNRKRATDKENALSAAIAILGMNPTLSADEAAPKIRERAGLSLGLRTIAGWIRDWRRDGTIGSASEEN